MPIVVQDAHADVLGRSATARTRAGGRGAVREVCDMFARAHRQSPTRQEAGDVSAGLFSLRDRVVVVTGGLGQLGRQFTAALLGSRRPRRRARPAGRRHGTDTDSCSLVQADVTNRGVARARAGA